MKTNFKRTIIKESQQTEFLTDESAIKEWLNSHKITDYEIVGGEVILKRGLNLHSKLIDAIPVKFKEINGSIDVSLNKLKRIDWAPKVVQGSFEAWDNEIETLEGGPEEVTGNFDVDNNKLTSLSGGPKLVTGSFICSDNPLGNDLTGAPEKVGKYFKAVNCGLKSLVGLPSTIGTSLYIQHNQISSFRGISKILKSLGANATDASPSINIAGNPIENGVASLAAVKGVKKILCSTVASTPAQKQLDAAIKIVNAGLNDGKDAIEIQDILDDAGLIKLS